MCEQEACLRSQLGSGPSAPSRTGCFPPRVGRLMGPDRNACWRKRRIEITTAAKSAARTGFAITMLRATAGRAASSKTSRHETPRGKGVDEEQVNKGVRTFADCLWEISRELSPIVNRWMHAKLF